jgi:hypothetical protein
MTFQTSVWAVDGNTTDGSFARQMLQSSTLGSQGVVGATDCQVQANSPNTSGIIITSGAVVIYGAETPYQGSYWGFNEGNDTTLSIAATGGSSRSDMIVARAEDPTWSGSPWGGSPAGQIIYPRVISNVAAGSTSPPAGYSCIPLARIDMPASTAVVAQSYIHDIRQVMNPQRLLQIYTVNGPTVAVSSTSSTSVQQFPPGAGWSVAVPSYATYAAIMWSVNELEWSGDTTVRANVWPIFGASVSSPVLTTPQSLVSFTPSNNEYRHTIGGGGTVAIPASMRGTTQTLQFAWQTAGDNGTMKFSEGASVSVLVEWQQLASAA